MKKKWIVFLTGMLLIFFVILFKPFSYKENPHSTYFQNLIEKKTSSLKKCYLTRLQHLYVTHGQVLIKITFHPQGYVELAQIIKSDFKDPVFLSCLQTSLLRTNFKPFSKGTPVEIVYPLNF